MSTEGRDAFAFPRYVFEAISRLHIEDQDDCLRCFVTYMFTGEYETDSCFTEAMMHIIKSSLQA